MRVIFHGLGAALVCLAAFAAPAAAQGDEKERAQCINEGLQFTPDVAIAACTTLIQSGRFSTANLAIAYNNRGNAHFTRQDNPHAIADLSEAIRLNPQYADAYFNRGNVYYGQQDYSRAVADYSEAVRLNPRDAEAFNKRADSYERLGDPARAAADRAEAARLSGQ
jgi:tetratricopeptide (TPR) repeat protein